MNSYPSCSTVKIVLRDLKKLTQVQEMYALSTDPDAPPTDGVIAIDQGMVATLLGFLGPQVLPDGTWLMPQRLPVEIRVAGPRGYFLSSPPPGWNYDQAQNLATWQGDIANHGIFPWSSPMPLER